MFSIYSCGQKKIITLRSLYRSNEGMRCVVLIGVSPGQSYVRGEERGEKPRGIRNECSHEGRILERAHSNASIIVPVATWKSVE